MIESYSFGSLVIDVNYGDRIMGTQQLIMNIEV